MRYSNFPIKTMREDPAEEVARNAKLLMRAGFIHKEMAGVYTLLPNGLKVVENIKKIVREEMNNLGASELLMTSLQKKELWEMTDRWDSKKVDIWFKTQLQSGTDLGLAWSHEEPVSEMLKNHISSYRDLPAVVYQFQNKLRNELRTKSGIMRSREFLMKDLYSYFATEEGHKKFYDSVINAYHNVFNRLGIGDITFFTFASGGAFTEFSHEFQTLTTFGEDTIFVDRKKSIAVNKDVMSDKVLKDLDLNKDDLEEQKASEVGNIFSFGDKKSKQMNLHFTDEAGHQKPVILGSYGIGITRLLGVLTEVMADDKGLVWPAVIAPAKVYILQLESKAVAEIAEKLYKNLQTLNIDTIIDDRNTSAGEKFSDADLLGIPTRVVVSEKTIKAGGVEVKNRISEETTIMSVDNFIKSLSE